MQLSKYNIYIKDDDKIQIFNTLTHSFVRLKQSDLEDARLHESQITQNLLDMGILINQANEDVYKYKYLYNTKKFRQDCFFYMYVLQHHATSVVLIVLKEKRKIWHI